MRVGTVSGSAALRNYAAAMLVERVAVGAVAFAAPGALLSGFGLGAEQDSPALRYFARLFGVRNAVLGVMVWQVRNDPAALSRVAAVNAVTEVVDAGIAAVPLVRRQVPAPAALGAMAASFAVAAGFAGLSIAARRRLP